LHVGRQVGSLQSYGKLHPALDGEPSESLERGRQQSGLAQRVARR
jgi:hypothetical protein